MIELVENQSDSILGLILLTIGFPFCLHTLHFQKESFVYYLCKVDSLIKQKQREVQLVSLLISQTYTELNCFDIFFPPALIF